MRTTITLEPDTEFLLRRMMEERRISFKEAVNTAIREGLGGTPREESYTTVQSLGQPTVDLVHALRVAASFEDEELMARMRRDS